jgi:8-hydroxy-5-deazaflavin:NADPH oxidoreductase
MKIAVFGTGMVGNTIASKMVSLGHDVKMGSRSANNEKAVAWAKEAGSRASHGTFAEAAGFGEIIFNCTKGDATLAAIRAAGARALEGKILVDISNPLDFSKGMPPSLFVFGTDSLAEQIQREFPGTRVVKALNTINANVMVDPSRVPGEHATFVSGNDAGAKQKVTEILRGFGWKQVVDLGDITTARGTEAYLMLWLRLWGALGTPDFNVQIVKAG